MRRPASSKRALILPVRSEGNQIGEERALAVNGVEAFSLFLGQTQTLLGNDAQTGFLEAGIDLASQIGRKPDRGRTSARGERRRSLQPVPWSDADASGQRCADRLPRSGH